MDYKVNVANSRKAHPDIAFYEMDLDHGNCQVEIPIEILLQSVVVSADVIEHIRDPKYCYIPLMKYLSQFVHAIVITSPDREGEGKELCDIVTSSEIVCKLATYSLCKKDTQLFQSFFYLPTVRTYSFKQASEKLQSVDRYQNRNNWVYLELKNK